MALLDPTDPYGVRTPATPHERTKRPAICLLSGFAVIVGAALAVHLTFNVLF